MDSSSGATAGSPSGASNMSERNNATSTSEVTRIFMNSFRTGVSPPEDTKYVGQVVAQRTGLSQSEAEKRVTDTYTTAHTPLNDAKAKAQETVDARARLPPMHPLGSWSRCSLALLWRASRPPTAGAAAIFESHLRGITCAHYCSSF